MLQIDTENSATGLTTELVLNKVPKQTSYWIMCRSAHFNFTNKITSKNGRTNDKNTNKQLD